MSGKNILITGATGFVGAHLLDKLAREKDVGQIFVLCRAGQGQLPIARVSEAFHRFCLNDAGIADRLHAVKGDISEKRLGLSESDYKTVCEKIDVIYHVAARVNHVLPYQALKAANVDSTAELMKIAITDKQKILNFVSTFGSASRRDEKGKFVEAFPDDSMLESDMGYLLSKWASEKLLKKFNDAGFGTNIFRLGYVTGHRESGVSLSDDNQLMLLIKSCIQLGYAPRLPRLINMTPVDAAAEVMAVTEFRERAGQVLNIANTTEYISWEEIIEWLNDSGYAIQLLEFCEWQSKIRHITEENALFKFLPLYSRADAEQKVLRFGKNITQYHTDESSKLIRKYGIDMPKVKYELLDKYFRYLRKIAFIPDAAAVTT
jgi:thioester reductase-like protein